MDDKLRIAALEAALVGGLAALAGKLVLPQDRPQLHGTAYARATEKLLLATGDDAAALRDAQNHVGELFGRAFRG